MWRHPALRFVRNCPVPDWSPAWFVPNRNSLQVSGVVYSLDTSMSERLRKLTSRIDALEQRPKITEKTTIIQWICNNKYESLSLSVAILAVGVSYFAWWQPQTAQHAENDLSDKINSQIEAKFKEHHFDDLKTSVDHMSGKMDEISGYLKIIVENDLKRAARLAPSEFNGRLPEIEESLKIAKIAAVQVSPGVVKQIQSNLIRARLVPQAGQNDYWKTASAFINYRSPIEQEKKPPCAEPFRPYGMIPLVEVVLWKDCEINLNGNLPVSIVFQLMKSHGPIECDNCRVSYSGGPITLFAATSRFICVNCVFSIVTPSAPPPTAQGILFDVLATPDLSRVEIQGLRG